MRILMFGWEFPPHISGGLGTACFELTRALSRHGAVIEFVVPRAQPAPRPTPVKLVAASRVPLPHAESVEDPKVYQKFFDRLSKSIFLELQAI